MARRGRPSKAGQRTGKGKLKRNNYPEPSYDKGSEWVQDRRTKYGTHYNTPLGRAYAAGLLGDEAQAQDRYNGGKRFARVYNRVIGGETYRCPLDRTTRGSLTEIEATEQDMHDRDWLFAVMDELDRSGARSWMDSLISSLYTDYGPHWLDRLLDGGRDPADLMTLKAAIVGLDIVAPPRKVGVIHTAHWDAAA